MLVRVDRGQLLSSRQMILTLPPGSFCRLRACPCLPAALAAVRRQRSVDDGAGAGAGADGRSSSPGLLEGHLGNLSQKIKELSQGKVTACALRARLPKALVAAAAANAACVWSVRRAAVPVVVQQAGE